MTPATLRRLSSPLITTFIAVAPTPFLLVMVLKLGCWSYALLPAAGFLSSIGTLFVLIGMLVGLAAAALGWPALILAHVYAVAAEEARLQRERRT